MRKKRRIIKSTSTNYRDAQSGCTISFMGIGRGWFVQHPSGDGILFKGSFTGCKEFIYLTYPDNE